MRSSTVLFFPSTAATASKENEPPSEQSSAHDELVGDSRCGVVVANMIEAREGAPLLVQDEVPSAETSSRPISSRSIS